MYKEFVIGDLVIAKNKQTVFNFSHNPADSAADDIIDNKMGLGVVVEHNPLFLNGCLKVWWSKAKKFTQEDSHNLRKLN